MSVYVCEQLFAGNDFKAFKTLPFVQEFQVLCSVFSANVHRKLEKEISFRHASRGTSSSCVLLSYSDGKGRTTHTSLYSVLTALGKVRRRTHAIVRGIVTRFRREGRWSKPVFVQ